MLMMFQNLKQMKLIKIKKEKILTIAIMTQILIKFQKILNTRKLKIK